jgi:hypothetical protein
MSLTIDQVAIIKGMLLRGDHQHDIAARYGVNGGRIAEIATKKKFTDVEPAPAADLPPLLPSARRFIDPNAPVDKQVEVFEYWLVNPPGNSRTVTITPELSAYILEKHGKYGNRKRKPARIRRYSDAIDKGEWVLTGEPLIFGVSTNLLDGQNRLAGCVRAGKPFRTDVRFGIDDQAFVTINSGVVRSAGDTFYTAGIKDPQIVSPAVRWLMLYEYNKVQDRTSYSNQEMMDFYRNNLDEDFLNEAIERAKKASKAVPRGALAAHFYLFESKHPDTAKRLAADFDKNAHGAKKLVAFLNKTRKDNFGRLNDVWINALLVQTWNAYRDGRLVVAKDLKWNGGTDDYPTIA